MTLSAGLSLAAMACAIALLASIASPLGVGLAGGATIGILALLVLAGFLTAQRWAMHTESIAAAESYETSLVTTGLSAIIAGCGEAEVALILREATGGIAEATEPQVVSPRQAA